MTNTNTSTSTDSTPKKSNKKTIIVILLLLVSVGLFDYFQSNVLLGKGECSSNDSTLVEPVAVDTIVPTPAVVPTVDTTKVDTTKK